MKILTAKQVAEKLQVDKSTVYQWAREGSLPCVKVGPDTVRFIEEKIDEWILSRCSDNGASPAPVNKCEQQSPRTPCKAYHPTKPRLRSH